MSKVDLHIHSNVSADGEWAPQEIVAHCQARGMALISLTDHNAVRGVAGALAAARGLRVLPGVELDCTFGGRGFHLLGYGFDYTRREFGLLEQDVLKQERGAATQKIRLFREATGIPVEEGAVLAAASGGVVTGELIAQFVLAQPQAARHAVLRPYLPGGEKSDNPHLHFYWDFFSQGKPAYVPMRYIALPDAVRLLHRAGGIAVLAHPGQNLAPNDPLLEDILNQGLDGIEAFSSYHSRETAAHYLAVAQRRGLLVTCGSDFHGKHKPKIGLGGHGATWEDAALLQGLEERLLGAGGSR